MRIDHFLKAAFLFCCIATPYEAADAQSSVSQAALQPGDHVRITVISDDKNLSGEFEVAPDSTLKHPVYNKVKVGGVRVPMLKETIASFLRRFHREPQLEVEPLFKVTIGGEVRSPSIYLLPPETTFADAVARAGGATAHGALDRVTLLRDRHKIALNLSETTPTSAFSTIESGDQITVARQKSVVGGIRGLVPILGVATSIFSLILLAQR